MMRRKIKKWYSIVITMGIISALGVIICQDVFALINVIIALTLSFIAEDVK